MPLRTITSTSARENSAAAVVAPITAAAPSPAPETSSPIPAASDTAAAVPSAPCEGTWASATTSVAPRSTSSRPIADMGPQ